MSEAMVFSLPCYHVKMFHKHNHQYITVTLSRVEFTDERARGRKHAVEADDNKPMQGGDVVEGR